MVKVESTRLNHRKLSYKEIMNKIYNKKGLKGFY